MPLTINPELIENSEVQITTNTDGDLVIENRLNGQTITLTDEGVEVPALSAESATLENEPTDDHDVARKIEVDEAGKTEDEVQDDAIIFSEGFAPEFAG